MKKFGNLFRALITPPLFILGVLSNIASGGGGFDIGPICIFGPCTPTLPSYTISGTVSGLTGTGLVLLNSSTYQSDYRSITANGNFTFPTAIQDGSSYNVIVLTQPTAPTQICTVNNGSGTVSGSNITNVSVVCVQADTIGGTVSGLAGHGFVLQNNGTDDLAITANGGFTFATALVSGSYNVTVRTQPYSLPQICTVNNGSGTVSGADITNISIVCTTITYTIGGTVSGLTGSGLVLQNYNTNSGGTYDLGITVDGVFTFPTALPDTYNYSVTVLTQPTGQTCTASYASGRLSGADVTNVSVTCSKVSPLYSTNGFNWNDYVQGSDIANATDTACDAATDTACLHGGEIRMVELTGWASCTGITASDALGAFDWICDDSTGTARVISSGLASGYGLANLLDFASPGWKENSLTVYKDAVEIETTTSAVWWPTPVVANTTGGALDEAGTIYVVPSDTIAAYTLEADSVALVAAPGVVINGPGVGYTIDVISARSKNFLWVEGMVSAVGDSEGVYWGTVSFSTMRNLTARYASFGTGVHLWGSSNNVLLGITASNNSSYGVYLESASNNNTLKDVTASNNSSYGIRLAGASGNTLLEVTTSNNSTSGVYLGFSSDNTLTGVSASGNGEGVRLEGASGNTLSGVTASNNTTGVVLWDSLSNTFSDVTASNNPNYGVRLSSYSNNNTLSGVTANNNGEGVRLSSASNNNTLSGVTASNNSYGVYLWNSSDNYFTGDLKVGNNAYGNCYESGGINPGLVHGTCANNGVSDATLTTGVTIAGAFIAMITTEDTVNISDTNGTASYADITDWSNFENPYRTWGKFSTYAFPSADQKGSCASGQTCQIWDWSLLSTDTVIKGVLPLPTGNDTLTHMWSDLSISTILRNAVEIQDDSIGNENTLCETDETCLYTPNMGAYQGHGNLISAGAFTDGIVTGVTLMKYESNGY